MTKSIRAWMAWAVVTFFYAYQYILRVIPGIMMDEIRLKYTVDASQFGDFSGIYYIGYTLLMLPIGYFLDRFGPRLIVSFSIVAALLGLVPLVYSDSWTMAVVGRFLLGIGSCGAILGVFKVIRQEFPAHRFATMLGLSVTVGVMGALYGGAPVQLLTDTYGWTDVLKGLMLLGFALAVGALIVFSNNAKDLEPKNPPSLLADIKAIFMHKKILWIALFAALMVGPLEGFADVWGKSFLVSVYGMDKAQAAFIPSLMFIGMAIGSPLLAYIAEKRNSFMLVTLLSGGGMFVLFSLFLFFALPIWAVYASLTLIGIFSAYQILAIHMNGTSVSKDHAGLATAFTNMVIMSFGTFFHIGIGKTMVALWDGQMTDTVAVYTPFAYRMALGLIPLGCLLGVMGFYFVKRKYRGN